jgi:hypothetical protein
VTTAPRFSSVPAAANGKPRLSRPLWRIGPVSVDQLLEEERVLIEREIEIDAPRDEDGDA